MLGWNTRLPIGNMNMIRVGWGKLKFPTLPHYLPLFIFISSESSSSYSVSAARSSVSRRSYSVSADSSNNSFIVFKSQSSDDKTKSGSDSIVFISDSESSATSKATVVSEVSTVASSGSGLDHWCKKAMWRSRNRKAYSLDITSNGSVAIQAKPFTFLYIQMQLCRQDSLQDWLRTNAKRHPDDVTSIFKQTLEAVEYVHLQNLIHRDLKVKSLGLFRPYCDVVCCSRAIYSSHLRAKSKSGISV